MNLTYVSDVHTDGLWKEGVVNYSVGIRRESRRLTIPSANLSKQYSVTWNILLQGTLLFKIRVLVIL